MSLIYVGIDEAGYGPMLGPLCVAAAVFAVDCWTEGQPSPDLWELLGRAVCKSASDSRRRVPVADSKQLKLPNAARRDPLLHLERGVLAFHHAWLGPIESDEALFDRLGVRLDDEPWYAGPSRPLPRAGTVEQLRIDANMLLREANAAGVRLVALRCLTLGESAFNAVIRQHGNKAATTTHALRSLVRRVLQDWPDRDIRIVCDRQGGRMRYADALGGLCASSPEPLEESPRASRYALGERVRVLLIPRAEQAHLPVALASMTAKLVRELAMTRFNQYWGERLPGLKGTAGYTQDARRWLDDAGAVLDAATREILVRLA
ncbi:MAG: hypothetical protein Kow0022_14030 [Phycisphaerales bacterium]